MTYSLFSLKNLELRVVLSTHRRIALNVTSKFGFEWSEGRSWSLLWLEVFTNNPGGRQNIRPQNLDAMPNQRSSDRPWDEKYISDLNYDVAR